MALQHRNFEKKLNKKKYCVLVCFFCMTVKNICRAPKKKWIEKKTHYQEKKSLFLIFHYQVFDFFAHP